MALHPDITRKSDIALALEAASGALLLASRQQTGNAGSVTIPNADGTKTIMGVGAGDTTVAKFVGDTTAPGKPTGVTASSRNAALWVSWDGTLAGGVPADFDHVELFAATGGSTVDLGALREAGTVTAADLTVGSEYTVTAIAYDDAHDAQGNSTPNASGPSGAVSVTIASAVDPGAVAKAQSDAQSALDQIGGVKSDLTATQQTANDAKEQSASAAQQSQRAEDTAKSANATSASASSTAQTALSTAQAAQNDTVTQNVNQYAINADPTTAPTTGWSPTAPAWTAGHYIWVRTIVGYGSGDYQTGDPVCVTGNTGIKGDPGNPGKDGEPGKDGTSVHIKGSVSTASELPSSATSGEGYMTVDDGHLHIWGDSGWQDVGVIRGPNGVSAYLHQAWSDSDDGAADFSTTDAGTRKYWGTYADNVPGTGSTKPSDYKWVRVRGADGSNGSNGVSVTSIIRYYALGTAAPAKPAVMAPPSPWQAAEPGYQRDVNLYTTERILYSDGQFAYTQVQLSSSYQYSAAAETAARDAVQTATNANTTANTATTAAANAASQAQSAQTTANLALANAQELVPTTDLTVQNPTGWNFYQNGQYNSGDKAWQWNLSSLQRNPIASPTGWDQWNKIFPAVGYDRTLKISIYWASWNKSGSDTITFFTQIGKPNGDAVWINEVPQAPIGTGTGVWTLTSDTLVIPAGSYIKYMVLNGENVSGNPVNFEIKSISIKDVTEAQAAQSAADAAQATATSAQSTATQATATANSAAQSATSAQTTANLALANAPELVTNGGFETGDDSGWSINATHQVVDDMASAHSGRYYLNAGSATEIIRRISVPVVPGHIYRFSGWYRRPSTNSSIIGGIRFQTSSDGNIYDDWQMTDFGTSEKDDWTYFSIDGTIPSDGSVKYAGYRLAFANTSGVIQHFDDLSFKDITEAASAKKAAEDAQATATSAATAAANADAKAVKAQAAASGAQTTADSKNTIRSSQSQPSAANTVPGDLWFQLDSSNHVTGIQVWNGFAYVDYVLVAQQVLVAGSVGTISLSDGAVTADKVTASEALLDKLLVRKIVADDIDVGNLAAAVIQSGMFKTGSSGARVTMDSTGIKAYDANGNVTFQVDSATGKATMVGGMATALSGKRISISQSGDTGKVALLNDGSELSSLTFIDNTNSSGYVYTGLYTGQNAQFIQFATLVDNVNHQPDPKVYDASITARGKMLLDASNAINVNGTWFAHDQASLPTAPQVVGGQGTKAFADGIEYTFDGGGAWVSQTHTWDDAMCVAVPTASSSTVNGTTSARMDTMTGDSDAYTRGSNYIQVAHAGTYLVSGAVQVSGVSGGSHHVNVAIGVDGYSSSNRYMSKEVGGGPGLDGAWITAVYPAVPIALTAGQRVYLIVACDVAGAVIQPNGCLLSITRIGD